MFCLLSVQQFQHTAKKSHKPQAKTKNSKDKSFEAKTHTTYFKKHTNTGKQKNKNTKDTKGKKPDWQAKAHKHKRANLNPKNNALTQNV